MTCTAKNYWLMKSEPETFSIDDLQQRSHQIEHWDGVRNYQVRNMLRDKMCLGDLAFFYHSNCDVPGIVGIMEIVRDGYPDFTALTPKTSILTRKVQLISPVGLWLMSNMSGIYLVSSA